MVEMGLAPTIHAASFGIQDSVFLMLLALIVFGPRRLPEIGRQIGKLMYEFRKVSNDFKFQMEEELRASEEAERQRKLQASLPPPAPAPESQATLDVPPHPVSSAEPVTAPETEPAAEAAPEPEVPAAADESSAAELPGEVGEVRGEPRRFPPAPPTIQPPSSGEPVAASRPFRSHAAVPDAPLETVTESGSEPTHQAAASLVVADEGRVGTEIQPGVDTEREAHHA
jgi:sec-independent protein translocase protein TatB